MRNLIILVIVLVHIFFVTSKAQRVTEDDIIPSEKNPATAFLYSLILPGLGQMYNEEVGSGFLLMFCSVTGFTITYFTSESVNKNSSNVENVALFYVGAIIYTFSFLYSIIDAPITAKKITEESRYKNARRIKRLSNDFGDSKNNLSLDLIPYFNYNSMGLQFALRF